MALVTEIEHLMDAYRVWLKDRTAVRDVNGTYWRLSFSSQHFVGASAVKKN